MRDSRVSIRQDHTLCVLCKEGRLQKKNLNKLMLTLTESLPLKSLEISPKLKLLNEFYTK